MVSERSQYILFAERSELAFRWLWHRVLHFGVRHLIHRSNFLSISPDRHIKPNDSIGGLDNLLLLKPFQICGVCVSILLCLNLTFVWSGIAIFSENKIQIFQADYDTYILKLVATVNIN